LKLPNDDELRQVSNDFLGPRGYQFPFRARYSAYGIGLTLAVAAFAVERRLGIGIGIWSVVWTVGAVVLATRWIGERVSYETPLRAVLGTFWAEVTAPRVRVKGESATLVPSRVLNRRRRMILRTTNGR
jgi:hypothetical protein